MGPQCRPVFPNPVLSCRFSIFPAPTTHPIAIASAELDDEPIVSIVCVAGAGKHLQRAGQDSVPPGVWLGKR